MAGFCTNCGAQLSEDARFCSKCGTAVVRRSVIYCTKCGAPAEADAKFCSRCSAPLVQAGENVVVLTAEKMTIFHEIMPAWVVGDFSLEPAKQGFVIVPDRGLQAPKEEAEEKPLVHSNTPDGVAWLSAGVDYQTGVRDFAPAITFTFPAKQTVR